MSAKGGFFHSRKYKLFTKYLSGFGASIVIVGALFKIMHWPGCDIMLIVGLLTEAAIFAFIALEPFHPELEWERVFPELDPNINHDDVSDENSLIPLLRKGSQGSPADDLADKMEKAGINDALLGKLTNSMSNLAENAKSISNMTSAASATDAYVKNLENASNGLNQLTEQYAASANAIAGISEGGAGNFGDEMQKLGNNLSSLNNVYELQLNSSQEYLNSLSNMNKLQESINTIMQDLAASQQDTAAYKENMAQLSQNLTDLNNVYGNMLRAMKG